jgi:thioredoxin 1
MQKIEHLAAFDSFLSEKKELILVMFTATWCGPCKQIKPMVERWSEEHKTSLHVALVDGDENEDILKKCGVTCYPTFQFYLHGLKLGECKGAKEDYLQKMLQGFLFSAVKKVKEESEKQD